MRGSGTLGCDRALQSSASRNPTISATVTRLMAGFRDHLARPAPPTTRSRRGVERLLGDPDTEFLLAAAEDGAPPAGVAQLRFRYGIWRAGGDCLLEDLFVDAARPRRRARPRARRRDARPRPGARLPPGRARRQRGQRTAQRLYESFGFSATSNPYGARDLYMRLHVD